MVMRTLFDWLFPNWKYVPVVLASRTADFVILIGGPLLFGESIVWYAWALGLFVDCVVEYSGHKLLTYHEIPNGPAWQIGWEFVAYLANRYGLGSLAAIGAWKLGDGEVGVVMFLYYAAISLFNWLLFQVQFNRVIFNFWPILRKLLKGREEAQ